MFQTILIKQILLTSESENSQPSLASFLHGRCGRRPAASDCFKYVVVPAREPPSIPFFLSRRVFVFTTPLRSANEVPAFSLGIATRLFNGA